MHVDLYKEQLRQILANPSLSAVEKKFERRRVKRQIQKNIDNLKDDLNEKLGRKKVLEDRIEAFDWIIAAAGTNVVMQPNDCSRAHRLADAFKASRVYELGDENTILEPISMNLDRFQDFVVKHKWGDIVELGEAPVKLPYEACLFEFKFSGIPVIVAAWQADGDPINCFLTLEAKNGAWIGLSEGTKLECYSIYQACWKEIKAICVALDAEVATSIVQRAPAALNRKRVKSGKSALLDFHVVDLSRRHRVSNQTDGHTGGKKRLHFRRGHWRHYENHTSWIRWTLVGNPDLGFVDKEYSL